MAIGLIGILSLTAQPPADAGSIAGQVKFIGVPPKRGPIKVTKDQDYCGQAIPDETYIIHPNGGLKNAVVFIDRAPSDPPPSLREHILDNKGCRFVPHVMALIRGERLVVKNSDPKLHIAHSYSDQRAVFNLSLPFRGEQIDVTQRIKAPGLLQVKCDSHAWMHAYIYVFDHPFFGVTGEEGDFHISDIPEGKYVLKAWHEAAGNQTMDVTVIGEDETKVSFEFALR